MIKLEMDHYELRFLIPTRVGGIIIGRSGENIKKLRKDFDVKITISDSIGPERLLSIEGELNAAMNALNAIFDREMVALNNENVDCRFLVHNSHVGVIIGRSGSKIREIRETSGLQVIKVYQCSCPQSTDRVVQLVGSIDDVIGCLHNIIHLISATIPKGPVHPYDCVNYDDTSSSSYGGWSFGLLSNRRSNYMLNPCFLQSYQNNSNSSIIAMNEVLTCRSSGPGGDSTAARVCLDNGLPKGYINLEPTTTTQVSISDKMIGAIMGKAGARINQVRRQSCACIKISKQETGVEDRIITISGTPEQIQNAQFLLQLCVKKYGDLS